MNNKPTLLLTGGCGFIGTNFILDWFQKNKGTLINLDNLTYAGNNKDYLAQQLKDQPYHFYQGDINNALLIQKIFKEHQPTAIIHMAAESHVDRSISSPSQFFQTNVMGTFTLLEQTKHYFQQLPESQKDQFRFVHVSTDEVYGSLTTHQSAFHEKTPYAPNSPYSASKAGSDHLVRSYFHTYQLPTIITNCSNNFGPYQNTEKLIPLMTTNALQNKPLPVYGKGLQIRDWIPVQDHCTLLQIILERGTIGESYALGGNQELSNLELVEFICQLLDIHYPQQHSYLDLITYVKDRPGHDYRYAIDTSKIEKEFNWHPENHFQKHLLQTIHHYASLIKKSQIKILK
jgi:dTDP-glucose 4,6-dehydratase